MDGREAVSGRAPGHAAVHPPGARGNAGACAAASDGRKRKAAAKGKKTDKVGFYNNKGAWVIKPQFDGTKKIKNGYAAAKLGGKWGVIDTSGNWVIKPIFDGIKDVEKMN